MPLNHVNAGNTIAEGWRRCKGKEGAGKGPRIFAVDCGSVVNGDIPADGEIFDVIVSECGECRADDRRVSRLAPCGLKEPETELLTMASAISVAYPLALTIATMPARTASGSFGHALTTAAKRGDSRFKNAKTFSESSQVVTSPALADFPSAVC